MRKRRKLVAIGFPILGMLMVFAAILIPAIALNLQLQIVVVLLGILIIEAGVWRLTAKVLPNERKYLGLRAEVQSFIGLIRVLNAQAINLQLQETETAKEHYKETIDALHAAVDRMVEVAGREG